MKKVYLICPVRLSTNDHKDFLLAYTRILEHLGYQVFYPYTDNPYETSDQVGDKICKANVDAIREADEVHIYWLPNSEGSKFDLGVAYALEKPIVIIGGIMKTRDKSFENLMLNWPFGVEFYTREDKHDV